MDINIKDLTEEQKEDLKQQLEEDEKIDFSAYVGRDNRSLCIKWKNVLISQENEIISYWETNRDFNDILHYETKTIGELEKGDLFIRVDDIDTMKLSKFKIYVGKNTDGSHTHQGLYKNRGVEIISSTFNLTNDIEVYKFLRV